MEPELKHDDVEVVALPDDPVEDPVVADVLTWAALTAMTAILKS